MKNIIKILAIALVAVMAVSCFAACGAKDGEKVYKIASDNAFPPFEFISEDGETYTGIDMDIMAAIAEDQGFKYEMVNVGFKAALGQVQAGQADAMIAGMTITDERKETFDFSEGYFEDGQSLLVPADSAIASFEDLAGKKVAVKSGTMGLEYAESIKAEYGFETFTFDGSNEMYAAVLAGTYDACFEDFSVGGYAIKNGNLALKTVMTVGENGVINPAPYGFAVKKGENAELIEMFNKGLENIKASGKYVEILGNYGISVDAE